jgi:hypothetical protein
MIGFIGTSVTSSLNYNQYSVIADLHTFQSTAAHASGFRVFTTRLPATDLNTETNTSNHYEVFSSSNTLEPENSTKTLPGLPSWLFWNLLQFFGTEPTCQPASSLVRYQRWAWRGRHRKHSFSIVA